VAIEIRDARPEEYGDAGKVTADSYREFARPESSWDEYLVRLADVADRVRRTRVMVAVEDGTILGTVTLELDGRTEGSTRRRDRENEPLAPGEAHVRMLGVAPEARGRGIGRMLMDACVEESLRAGKTLLTLNTTERMKAARAMYESMGFARADDMVFPDGFVLLSYELPLDGRKTGEGLHEQQSPPAS
jgi:ribosomal protein S18 acetylase RimI-like enzyme